MEELGSLELRVSDQPAGTYEVRSAVERVAARYGLSEEACFDLKVATTEALTNALRGAPPGNTVDVAIVPREDAIEVAVQNRGLVAAGRAERTLSPECGRGIPLMLALVDEVEFASSGGRTLVRIRKRIL